MQAFCESVPKRKFCRFSKTKNELFSFFFFEAFSYQPIFSALAAKTGRMFSIESNFNLNAVLYFLYSFLPLIQNKLKLLAFKTNFVDL